MEFTYHTIFDHYHFNKPTYTFLRHNENLVYKIDDQNGSYLLRIHKPIDGFSLKLYQRHYSQMEYIKGEMKLLEFLSEHSAIKVQKPVKNIHGELVSCLDDGTPVTVLTWLDGDEVKKEMCSQRVVYQIGEMVGKLHLSMSKMKKLPRYRYDQELVYEMKKEIEVAHRLNHLTNKQTMIVDQVLDFVKNQMDLLDQQKEDKVLVHYDFGLSNLIIKNEMISPIDFSLSGYGNVHMDLGLAIGNFKDIELKKAMIKGFEHATGKTVDISLIETFLVFSILLFITFQHEKISKEKWFDQTMTRWENTMFIPLLEGKSFLLHE